MCVALACWAGSLLPVVVPIAIAYNGERSIWRVGFVHVLWVITSGRLDCIVSNDLGYVDGPLLGWADAHLLGPLDVVPNC